MTCCLIPSALLNAVFRGDIVEEKVMWLFKKNKALRTRGFGHFSIFFRSYQTGGCGVSGIFDPLRHVAPAVMPAMIQVFTPDSPEVDC